MVCCWEIILCLEMCGISCYSVSVFFWYNAFNDLFVEGSPIFLHHLRIVLSVTPYILPISVNGFSFISCNNSSFDVYVVKQKCTTANVVIYSDISLFYYQKFFFWLNFALSQSQPASVKLQKVFKELALWSRKV